MTPFIEKINDQWLHPFVERLSDRQKLLREKGNDFLAGLQERQEKLFDRGQRAINHFETNVLERVAEMLHWAYTRTGERSEALKKTWDYVNERIEELHAEDAGEAFFDEEELDGIETKHEEAVAEPKAEAKKKAKPRKKAEVKTLGAPFGNYDELNVKKLATRFTDLNEDQLKQAREYEAANKNRKTVFDTIDRLLG